MAQQNYYKVEPSRALVPPVRAVPPRGPAGQGALRELGQGRGARGPRRGLRLGRRSTSARSTASATSRLQARGRPGPRPPGFKEAWKALFEAGWRTLAVEEKHGGQAGPFTLAMMVEEFMCGSSTSFNMYPALTQGAADVILAFGTPEQQDAYVGKMFDGTWAGTMCLTEPQAGTDVGSVATQATKRPDGTYNIKGTKIFISGGDQDMTANIIHLVLARTPDAPPGTKGLSLFIVPKTRVDGTSNDVATTGIEHKMGINGSSTALLAFGDNGDCIGELVGTVEQKGMSQMFQMMNFARIGVGLQGLSIASLGVPQRARLREGPQAGQLDQALEGRDRAPRADHRAPRRPAHAARHEVARRGHPRARREADHAHRSPEGDRDQRWRQDPDRVPPGPGRSAGAAGQGVRLATRRSRSARPRSRSTAAPASSRTSRSSSTAATRRSSRSTRAPTTSRRWTSSAAS